MPLPLMEVSVELPSNVITALNVVGPERLNNLVALRNRRGRIADATLFFASLAAVWACWAVSDAWVAVVWAPLAVFVAVAAAVAATLAAVWAFVAVCLASLATVVAVCAAVFACVAAVFASLIGCCNPSTILPNGTLTLSFEEFTPMVLNPDVEVLSGNSEILTFWSAMCVVNLSC